MFQKTVWICFGIALILVNVIAEVGERYTGVHIHMILRLSLVLGVTIGVTILAGSIRLVESLDEERPLSGKAKNTLGPDRRQS
jgi:hypothetical protein